MANRNDPSGMNPPKKAEPKPTFYETNRETNLLFNNFNNEFARLTSDKLKLYFEAARRGVNFFKAFLFEEIKRRDLRIGGLFQLRKLSLLGQDWKIDGEDAKLKEFVEGVFKRFPFDQFLTDLVEAQLQGQSHFVIRYDYTMQQQLIREVELIPNYLTHVTNEGVKFIDLSKTSYYDIQSSATEDNPRFNYIDIDPLYLFSVYSLDGNEENGLLNGLIDGVIWAYFFKSYSVKDWAIFLERFATPGVVGEYEQLMSPADKKEFKNAVMNFGNLFRAVIPSGAKINLLNDPFKANAGNIYSEYIKYWNDELAIRILGQPTTTDTSAAGSYARAKVGDNVRIDLRKGDLALVSRAVNEVIKKIIDINFAGENKAYPVFSFTAEIDIDEKVKRADLLVKLKQAGFDIDPEYVKNEFGIDVEKSVGTTLRAETGNSSAPKGRSEEEFGEVASIDKFLEKFLNAN